MKNEVDALAGSSDQARHRHDAADVPRVVELRLHVLHETLLAVGQRLAAGRQVAALDDEPGHDPVEGDAVVDAGVDQPQEVADVVRRAVRVHVDGDAAVGRVQDGPEGGELGVRLRGEGRNLRRRLVADRHPPHHYPLGGASPGVYRGLRDPGDDVHAVGHLAPDGVQAVEPRLIDDADEELRAAAVRLSGHEHRRDRAPQVPGVAELGADQTEAALVVLGGALGIRRQRVAALHDAVGHHAVERRPVEVALPGELHDQADVIGGEIGPQIDGDRAEIGLEDRLLAAHLLERERGDERLGGLLGECRSRGQRRQHGDRRQPGESVEPAASTLSHSEPRIGLHLHTSRCFHLHVSP